ncbi:MAG: lipopolysaccharide biosynthesis protein [Candidatus Asgardarchaeia archaeon]
MQLKMHAFVISLILLMLIVCSLSFPMASANVNKENSILLDVLFLSGYPKNRVDEALGLDPSLNVTKKASISNLSTYLSKYDVVFILDFQLSNSDIQALKQFITDGGGLVIFMGLNLTYNPSLLFELGVIKTNSVDINTVVGITSPVDDNSPFVKNIAWNSIPETYNYTSMARDNVLGNVVLEEDTTRDALLITQDLGNGRIVTYAGWMTSPYNREISLWPYFTYFVYMSILYSAQQPIPEYADWPYSPVPHEKDTIMIGTGILILVIFIGTLFIYFRRKSREPIQVSFEEKEAKKKIEKNVWEKIGMHRQIGGFLYSFFITLILVIPYAVLTSLVFPRYIMPFPQAAGWYNWTTNFFLALWTLFDVGTSTAMVKYFAEYRVDQPHIAVRYVQLFIWWQMLSGLCQLFLVAFLGSIFFSRTFLAYLSWIFVAHSIIQFPGMLLVFSYLFQAMQRLDYKQVADLLYYSFFTIFGQYSMILIFREWGKSNPIFGEALGAGIGYAVGQYVANWMMFFFTLILFKRMGFRFLNLLRVDFGKEEIKKAFTFGGKWTFGSIWVPLVWFFQMYLLSIWLLNYSAWMGYWGLAWGLTQIVSVISLFLNGFLPGISESYSHKKQLLTDLYVSRGLKWANYLGFWLVSSLFAVGSRFILGAAGPVWATAIILIPPLLVFQLLGPYSWFGDNIFAGVGRTGTAAAVWILEQGLRAMFLVIFIPMYGMLGVVYAYIPALAAKDAAVWILVRKYISRPKPYWWQIFIAPGLAAILNYLWLEALCWVIWDGGMLSSVLIFFIGTFVSLFIYAFIAGVTGAWDKNTLNDLDLSTRIVKGITILSRLMYKMSAWGSRISPFFNKYPIDIYDDAMREAEELTKEKKALII